jgi:hypothetical protein
MNDGPASDHRTRRTHSQEQKDRFKLDVLYKFFQTRALHTGVRSSRKDNRANQGGKHCERLLPNRFRCTAHKDATEVFSGSGQVQQVHGVELAKYLRGSGDFPG